MLQCSNCHIQSCCCTVIEHCDCIWGLLHWPSTCSTAYYSTSPSPLPPSSTPTVTPTPTTTFIPMLSEESEPSLEDQVQTKLNLDGHVELADVVPLMRKDLQEAILNDVVSIIWYEQIKERVRELRKGHLARSEDDSSAGAIHWFEGNINYYCLW